MTESIAHHEVHRDDEGSKLGIWLFIFTELLFFGGLFITYAVYRHAQSCRPFTWPLNNWMLP